MSSASQQGSPTRLHLVLNLGRVGRAYWYNLKPPRSQLSRPSLHHLASNLRWTFSPGKPGTPTSPPNLAKLPLPRAIRSQSGDLQELERAQERNVKSPHWVAVAEKGTGSRRHSGTLGRESGRRGPRLGVGGGRRGRGGERGWVLRAGGRVRSRGRAWHRLDDGDDTSGRHQCRGPSGSGH